MVKIFHVKLLPQELEIKMIWLLWIFKGSTFLGDEIHLSISGIMSTNVIGFRPGRKRRTSKWMMGCRASGLIGLMVSWLNHFLLLKTEDFKRVGAGKAYLKTSDSVVDKKIYGRLLPRPMFGHLWSGGISDLTLFPLFPLGACRVGKDLSDFWWLGELLMAMVISLQISEFDL